MKKTNKQTIKTVITKLSTLSVFFALSASTGTLAYAQGTGTHGRHRQQQQQAFCYDRSVNASYILEDILKTCSPGYDRSALINFRKKIKSSSMFTMPPLYKHGVRKAFSELNAVFEEEFLPEASEDCVNAETKELGYLEQTLDDTISHCGW